MPIFGSSGVMKKFESIKFKRIGKDEFFIQVDIYEIFKQSSLQIFGSKNYFSSVYFIILKQTLLDIKWVSFCLQFKPWFLSRFVVIKIHAQVHHSQSLRPYPSSPPLKCTIYFLVSALKSGATKQRKLFFVSVSRCSFIKFIHKP